MVGYIRLDLTSPTAILLGLRTCVSDATREKTRISLLF